MTSKAIASVGCALFLLAACEPTPPTTIGGSFPDVPEAVVALADPSQNVATARVLPADGCYWYEHAGPVETTLLPLRTIKGNPICTQREEPAEAA
ncbi:MAG: hypothetical protein AAF618_07800 [Pseudomonadota bacterium]